jgi:SAM-dependent methyltransferase
MKIPSIISSTLKSECVITGSPVVDILDFGQHPFADTFITTSLLNISEPVFPLRVCLAPESGSIQLKFLSNSFDRYNLYDYSYTSSNSAFSRKHWDDYTVFVKTKVPPRGFIVEIGSNDGYLINQFNSPDSSVLGVDSSGLMCDISNNQGIPTIHGTFSANMSAQIVDDYGHASIILANNVLNHSNDPVDFVRGVASLLKSDGYFIFEVPYWLSMIESGKFLDQVYHEHISYFTLKSINTLLTQCGMYIVSADVVNYHGGSIRIVSAKGNASSSPDSVMDSIKMEESKSLFSPYLYTNLQQNFEKNRFNWLCNFYAVKEKHPSAAFMGVGAAAKANTWLNWNRFDKTMLNCITDSSEFKIGKYTPLSRIPIKSDDEFTQYDEAFALILSWNINEQLKNSLLKINPNIKFLHQ